jgi:predicted nucleic acid-binding protein
VSLPRLYVERTIPSYLVARASRNEIMRGQQAATREWWEHGRAACEPFVSQFVDIEAERGDAEMARARIAAIAGWPRLPVTEGVRELAAEFLNAGLIPSKAAVDAAHIAVAAVHGMDILLTWNCTHIHNIEISRQIERVCARRLALPGDLHAVRSVET